MENETKMIFRKFEDGEIIALMPELSHDCRGHYCESYMHIGQHGGADLQGVVAKTTLALPSEYADLQKELETIGYHVRPVKRDHPIYRAVRRGDV